MSQAKRGENTISTGIKHRNSIKIFADIRGVGVRGAQKPGQRAIVSNINT